MKRNYLYILTFALASLFLISACGDDKKDEKKDENEKEVKDDEVKDDEVDEEVVAMTIEDFATKRAELDCQLQQLMLQSEAMEDGEEKTAIQDQITVIGEELNNLNIEFGKQYGDSQEDMEKHQSLYEEKMAECQ